MKIFHSGSGLKSKIEFVWNENPLTPSPICHRPNFTRGPRWRLTAQKTSFRDCYRRKTKKKLQFLNSPSNSENGNPCMHFQWKYSWLNVWHAISQQPCEIERWFQLTTYSCTCRKPCTGSPMVTLQVLICPGSADTDFGWGGKLNGHLMASCVGNILTKKWSVQYTWLIDWLIDFSNSSYCR